MANHGDCQSKVVHLCFGERSVEGEIQGESPKKRHPPHEAIGATL